MTHFVATALNNPVFLGILSGSLIVLPIAGMWAVHKYKWQHWAPFDKTDIKQYNMYIAQSRRDFKRTGGVNDPILKHTLHTGIKL